MEACDLALHQGVRPSRAAATIVGATLLATGVAPAALAAPKVTLNASKTRVSFGSSVTLHGKLSPAAAGSTVRIVDGSGRVRARAKTDAQGLYSAKLAPRRRVVLRARSQGITSAGVWIRVRPHINARLRGVKLFGRARVTGVVRPRHGDGRVTVRLFRNGKPARKRKIPLDAGGFAARFAIRRPGTYRAKVSFNDSDHLGASDASTRRSPKLPQLTIGSRGAAVKRLERKLRRLNYHIKKVNRHYDLRTSDAVRAFHKVQGAPRIGTVVKATWRALASPKRPRPRSVNKRFHIEIDQTKQVLYTVRRGKVTNILHTSTGKDGITRDGVWYVFRKIAGYSPGRLYYPSYFDGLRAIHGWPEVPTSAASHGCARVPMWAARWIYRKAGIGTQIRIYH
ncbi:MAG: L,D-transpeptidase family protein [Actinomycetota bacterium]